MVHHSILIYTELLLHADVHLQQDPSRHFYFNETNHISTFHNLLWQAENAMLECDARLISRAVNNLVQNSIKHNPQGCKILLSLKYTFTNVPISDSSPLK